MTYRPLPVRLVVLVAVVASLVVAGSATGEPPQISAKRAEAQRVLDQIQELDGELEHAIEAYNQATSELQRIRAAREVNKGHLHVARRNLKTAQRVLAARLKVLYKSDEEDSTIAILLGSRSLSDFLARVDTVNRVASQDSQVLGEIRRFKREVEHRAVMLKRADRRQTTVVGERAAAQRRVEAGLAERQRLLGSIKGEIAELQAEEARRQELLRQQAEARLRAQLAAQRNTRIGDQEQSTEVVGAAAITPDGETIAPPAQYGGVVGIAMQYLGVPYVWGGASPETGFDCSGFIMYVFAQVGVSLPHHAASQFNYGTPVSRDQLEPGDLVFFNGLGHAGIYIGGGQFIHAPHTGDVVKISSLDDSWYAATWYGARRL
jgi:cell wall-associated NlpC family hydrolase